MSLAADSVYPGAMNGIKLCPIRQTFFCSHEKSESLQVFILYEAAKTLVSGYWSQWILEPDSG